MELVSIPDMSLMKVKTYITEINIERVEPGQRVIITLDALPGPVFYGEITSIATLARSEEDSDMKVFDIEIAINGSDERIKPGMTAQCKIITNRFSDVLSVPLESVFEKGDTTIVYVKNGGYEPRPVKVGEKNSNYIIIEEGLSEGDLVTLIDPTMSLEDIGFDQKEGKTKSNKENNSSAFPL